MHACSTLCLHFFVGGSGGGGVSAQGADMQHLESKRDEGVLGGGREGG